MLTFIHGVILNRTKNICLLYIRFLKMSKSCNNSAEWKCRVQKEINEPSDPQSAAEELRALVKSM